MLPAKLSILLVEDHADTVQIMTRVLQGMGCTVVTAGTVAQALQLAEKQTFQLLLCDLTLPDGDGTEVLRHLQPRGVKSIAVSGSPPAEGCEFDCHLIKPVDLSQLQQTIEKLCGEKK